MPARSLVPFAFLADLAESLLIALAATAASAATRCGQYRRLRSAFAEAPERHRRFMSAVVEETENYAGQVLLVHGDLHVFKMDKPLYSLTRVRPNLTRLQTFGNPSIHWVKVYPRSDNVFRVEPVMVRH
jgi:hypothetical protein